MMAMSVFDDSKDLTWTSNDTVSTFNQIDWDDRIGLQGQWSNEAKGWKVNVEWKETHFGAGLFALEAIPAGTVLRNGQNGRNLIQFRSVSDIEDFCQSDDRDGDSVDRSRLLYVKDYLWGFNTNADERGYELAVDSNDEEKIRTKQANDRFFGMWIPGNGLNHHLEPNTVYRQAEGGTKVGINLVALRAIAPGEELFDDYRRHGTAPQWLSAFAEKYGVSLNFADCNDFVR